MSDEKWEHAGGPKSQKTQAPTTYNSHFHCYVTMSCTHTHTQWILFAFVS